MGRRRLEGGLRPGGGRTRSRGNREEVEERWKEGGGSGRGQVGGVGRPMGMRHSEGDVE